MSPWGFRSADKAVDRLEHDAPICQIDFWDEVGDKRYFEPPPLLFDHEPVLLRPMSHGDDHPDVGTSAVYDSEPN